MWLRHVSLSSLFLFMVTSLPDLERGAQRVGPPVALFLGWAREQSGGFSEEDLVPVLFLGRQGKGCGAELDVQLMGLALRPALPEAWERCLGKCPLRQLPCWELTSKPQGEGGALGTSSSCRSGMW